MSIKETIRSAWKKVACKHDGETGKTEKNGCGCGKTGNVKSRKCGCDNAELAADEVIKKEVYPNKPIKKTAAKSAKQAISANAETKTSSSKKAPSKRTRPTNCNYRMINRNDDTCDSGKS